MDGFWPPASRIEPLAQENLAMNIKAAWLAGTYYYAEQAANGDITITNIGASHDNSYICGDSNNDDSIDILDITTSVNSIITSNESNISSHCSTIKSDVNNDTLVNILDIIILINHITNNSTIQCPTTYITNLNNNVIEELEITSPHLLQHKPESESILIHDCAQNYTFDVAIEPETEINFL